MSLSPVEFLLARKSPPIVELTGPGPTDADIATMIRIASRVPDHGRLTPWRFMLYRGAVRERIGERLADLAEQREGPLSEARRQQELTRFSRAPVVIAVISTPRDNPKIPQWEMTLSGGAAAMNLLHAAHALGFAANWITNWYAYDSEACAMLGVAPDERVIGFVHIGAHAGEVPERHRPDPQSILTEYSGPLQSE